ncbi:MAG: mechanosensitive ion channel domain-containing protein [Planctomycetota bacterium]
MRSLLAALVAPALLGSVAVADAAATATAPWTRTAGRQGETAQAEGEGPVQDLGRAQVEERLEWARALEDVEGEARSKALVLAYKGALDELTNAEAWRATRATIQDAADRAPEEKATLEAELAGEPEPPEPIGDRSLVALETQASEAQTERGRAQAVVDRLLTEQSGETERRREMTETLSELLARIEDLDETLRAGSLPEEDEELAAARLALARAQRQAASAHVEAIRTDEQTFDVRSDLRALRLRAARRRLTRAEDTYAAVETALLAKRREVTEEEEARARETALQAVMEGAAFSRVAQKTLDLRENSAAVARRLEEVAAALARARAALEEVGRRFDETQRRVEIVGLTNAISLHLRQERRRIFDVRAALYAEADVQAELTETQVLDLERSIAVEELRNEEAWIDGLVRDSAASGKAPDDAREVALRLLEDLYDALREDREILVEKFDRLVELDVARRELGERLDEYEDYVAERVLWIQSAPPIWRMPANAFTAEVRTLASAPRWSAFFRSVRASFSGASLEISMVLVGLLALLGARGSSRRVIRHEGEAAKQRQQVSILPTVRALFASTILAASYAAPFLALRFLGGGVFSEDPFAAAFGLGCDRAAAAALIFGSLRVLTTPGGLAECHFDWSERSVRLVRRYSTLVLPITPLAALAGDFLLNVDSSANADALARLAFLVESGSVLFFLWRVLHPSRGVLAVGASAVSIADWAFRLRRLWFLIAVGVTAALVVLALVGFGYTARNLFGRIEFTLGFLLALLVVRALALRWVTLARRNEALQRWRRKREEETQKRLEEIERRRSEGEEIDDAEVAALSVEEETTDFAALSSDVRDLVRITTGFAALAGVVGIWSAVLPALGIFERVHLWQREVSSTEYVTDAQGVEQAMISTTHEWVSLGNLGIAAIVLLLTWLAVRNVAAILELVFFRRIELGAGERYAIATLVRYVLTLVGIAVAFDEIGLAWSQLQWLVAGVSVGLGFGLQEIFANVVSGITLLFERPVRVGDWVTLGEIEGVVSKIRIRATTIRDRELKELIVPNREFINGQFINWTLSDPVSRVTVSVGIAYGSDTETAIKELLRAGRECPYAVEEPSPNVVFSGFGSSSLDFELRIFVSGRESYPRVVHDLHMRVDAAFRAAGIEISFPQRDLHIRTAEGLDSVPHTVSPARS